MDFLALGGSDIMAFFGGASIDRRLVEIKYMGYEMDTG
jgi:hypothetical protein